MSHDESVKFEGMWGITTACRNGLCGATEDRELGNPCRLRLPPSPCLPTQNPHMSPGQLDLQAEAKRMLSVASIFPTMAQMGHFREPLRPRFPLCRDRLPFLCLG